MKYLNDYKGKWFCLSDEPDEMYGDTIEDDQITDEFLAEHADACIYYGIPMYFGKDGVLSTRCEKALEVAIIKDELKHLS